MTAATDMVAASNTEARPLVAAVSEGYSAAKLISRFWSKVLLGAHISEYRSDIGPCDIWSGAPSSGGYGQFMVGRKQWYAHRLVYELRVGPIPEGAVLDHLCRVRLCVNASHLEPVSIRENVYRGEHPNIVIRRAGVCKRGHEFTPENTLTRPNSNHRRCRQCEEDGRKSWRSADYVPPSRPRRSDCSPCGTEGGYNRHRRMRDEPCEPCRVAALETGRARRAKSAQKLLDVQGWRRTDTPKRIHRRRVKGWRAPGDAIYVGRPTCWGNPFAVDELVEEPGPWGRHAIRYLGNLAEGVYCGMTLADEPYPYVIRRIRDRADAVELFRAYIAYEDIDWSPETIRRELGGRDLACWCPLDQPCHADVLLEIANGGPA